jgi:hypothetical protein
MSILSLAFVLACLPYALIDFVQPIFKSDNAVQIEDAYKWIFQATRGGEHAAPSREGAKSWLDNEWSALGDDVSGEKEWSPLCPDGTIGRVNLRPFRKRGGKADDIVNAFLNSAVEFRSEPADFTAAWDELGKRLKKSKIGVLTYKSWQKFDKEMKAKGYPAVHHSESYNKSRRPAYRVVTLANAQRLIPS